ncbi:diguanylate cyclase [Thermosipho atlanticus]|uniref:PAS domain S-box-containing protein/diguanylate cyclase (GGDEF) domain-containing protein n=1 Tax=Thermosipho atlanticus DSM 15807 TaxID=1123380 RepID=A0A1M5TBY0_9BACT|nr:diguanylate cyclase [Thermosipho atlanticus]SHH48120.1 PAS domain S-box-containing protein/diguanylate cyclase (GGDEF) domain-containing protein [Thermosipho atlanticus DSM 15807]
MILTEKTFKNLLNYISDGVYLVDTNRKILYWNKRAEEITGYQSKEVVGKYCFNDDLRHIDESGMQLCDKDCPLVIAIKENKYVEKHVFLHHRNGYRVPVNLKTFPVIDDMEKVIGAICVFNSAIEQTSLRRELEECKEQSYVDDLTGVFNRKGLEFFLNKKIKEVKRYKRKICVLFLDLDDFKVINDVHGHCMGDKVLKIIAESLKNNLRADDIVARFGGDEFVVISEINDKFSIEFLARKIKMLVEYSFFKTESGDVIKTSASIGGTMIKEDDTVQSILRRADKLMYESKLKGKNTYTIS